MVLLRRAPALVVDAPSLDDEQRAVLATRAPVLRVLGAPGTGKTTTAVELVVDRVLHGGLTPDECLLLTPTRVAAARLRERVTARLARTSTEPLARTHQAFGFGILRREAALRGDDAPRLISGPEQDVILRDLLARPRSRRRPAAALARARPRGPRQARLPRRAARPAHAGRRARDRGRPARGSRRRARPAGVGRGGAGASRVRRGHRVLPARAPTTRPGSSPPPPTCSRTTPTRWREWGRRCGSSSSTTPRSSPSPRPGCSGSSPPPGPTWSSWATPTRRSRRSAAPTRASWPTAGPTSADATRRVPSRRRSSCTPHTGSRRRSST